MTFLHKPVSFPYARQENRPEGRRYVTPEGRAYPSITTILGSKPKEALEEWKKRVGEREASKICKQAADSGTELHDALEAYLGNQSVPTLMPDVRMGVKRVQQFLDKNVTKVYALECPVYSDTLRTAGTCDFFGEMHGVPVVGDFKTTRSPKKREWIDDYFVQATFYAYAIWERTGIRPRRVVIMMTTLDGRFQLFDDHPVNWINKMQEVIEEFHTRET